MLATQESPNTLPSTSSSTTTGDDRRLWEAEKAELTKARDDAISKAEASNDAIKKANEETKSVRFSNVRIFFLPQAHRLTI